MPVTPSIITANIANILLRRLVAETNLSSIATTEFGNVTYELRRNCGQDCFDISGEAFIRVSYASSKYNRFIVYKSKTPKLAPLRKKYGEYTVDIIKGPELWGDVSFCVAKLLRKFSDLMMQAQRTSELHDYTDRVRTFLVTPELEDAFSDFLNHCTETLKMQQAYELMEIQDVTKWKNCIREFAINYNIYRNDPKTGLILQEKEVISPISRFDI